MKYRDLRKLFHISETDMQTEYQKRFSSDDTSVFGLKIGSHDAFLYMDSEVYQQIIRIERLDKAIQNEMALLPGAAVQQYINATMIDEIVLTNEIEGVNSSRKEIGDVFDDLAKNDKRGRFHGIVEKYAQIIYGTEFPLDTCEDIRLIYNDLVLDEVLSQNKGDEPDGLYFRTRGVSVLNAAGIPIHEGLDSEAQIMEYMASSLAILHDENIELLVRVALFHFLFSYIHPFYDGNGRTNRFISSYMIAQEFSPIVGLKISHAVKQDIEKYYKAFSMCEHPLNKGDLTPFVIMFNEMVEAGMISIVETLRENRGALEAGERKLQSLLADEPDKLMVNFGYLLLQGTLFGNPGISMKELESAAHMSTPTVRKRLDAFRKKGLLKTVREGRRVYYEMDMDELAKQSA